ncbi:MAG: hypothetical protein ACUVQP_12445, partial [Bacteroidales bacterium]
MNKIKEGREKYLTADEIAIKNAILGEGFDPFLLERTQNLRHLKDPIEALNIYIEAALKKAFIDVDRYMFNTIKDFAISKAKQAEEWIEQIDEQIDIKIGERTQKIAELEKENPARPKEVIEAEINALDKQIQMLDDKKATDPNLNQKGWFYIKEIIKEYIEEMSTAQKVSDKAFLDAMASKEPFSIAFLYGYLKNPFTAKKLKIRNAEIIKTMKSGKENVFRFKAEVWNDTKKVWEKRYITPDDVIGKTPISKMVGNVKMLHYSAVLGLNLQNFILQTSQIMSMLAVMPTHLGIIPTLKSLNSIATGLFKTLATIFDPKARAQLHRQGVFATLERIIGDAPEKASLQGSAWQNAWSKLLESTLIFVKWGEYFTRVWSYEMSKNILKSMGKDKIGLYEINQISVEMSRFTQQFWSPIHTERMLKGNFAKALYHLSSYTIKQWKFISMLWKENGGMGIKNPYVRKFWLITRNGGDTVGFLNKLNNSSRLAVIRWALLTYATFSFLKIFFDITIFN